MSNVEAIFSRKERNVLINREFVHHKLKCNPKHYPLMLEERFPHVLERIVKLWDSADGEDYLNDLLKPNSSGGRQGREGFPEQAWDEIFQLLLHYRKPRPNQNNNDELLPDLQKFRWVTSLLSLLKKDITLQAKKI